MTQEVTFARPELFSSGRNVMDCTEYLICSSLQTSGLPFHWLFSDSWGFVYRSLSDFSALPPGEAPPFWTNLEKLYGVRRIEHEGRSLKELAEDIVLGRGSTIVLTGDIWHIPWSTICYRETHNNHDILITAYNPASHELYVVDFVPEHAGWVDYEVVDAFFSGGAELNGRTYGFELTAPSLRADDETLFRQLNFARTKMAFAVKGLERMHGDLARERDCTRLVDAWWDPMRPIVAYRESFLEFVLFMQHLSLPGARALVQAGTADTLASLASKWFSLRNNLKKLQMKGAVPAEQIRSRLAPIIELEKRALADLTDLLGPESVKEASL
ncbi:cysteine peptidase family C39 domain-containing protein [Paenibacillus xanthanilyticus]|uniref:Butirosin biosynthesis protein H N-terminal domain-containing protein n=1 Tax=Paenibacillus xanthanilyticus TaxID=1783531 RepID=A0ABV8K5Z6_9BACL